MKRLFAVLVFITCSISAYSQNDIFAAHRNDDILYCIRFKNDISLIISINTEINKYSDFGNSVLFSNGSKMFIFGISSFDSFLSKKYLKKKIEVQDILVKYFEWEKKYQEKENGYIFKDELEFIKDESGRIYGHYKYYGKKSIDQLKDTETVFTEGYIFIFSNYIIYANAPIIKMENIEEVQSILKDAIMKIRVTDKIFEEKELFKIYDNIK